MTRVISGVPRLSECVCVCVCVCGSSSQPPVLFSLGASGTSQEEGLEGGGRCVGRPRLLCTPALCVFLLLWSRQCL